MRIATLIPIALVLALSHVLASADDATAAANDPVLSLKQASETYHWKDEAAPVKIVGPIYFVGTQGLSVWLITTSKGHILLNTGMPGSGPMIEASIRKLGFKPEEIKYLIAGHAHVDHVGALAYLKKATGAKVAIMDAEANLLRAGGVTDFLYGRYREFHFDRVVADRVLHDGETLALGKIKMTARLTPGHTRGATTWITTVSDHGKKYTVVFPDGANINSSYRVGKNPSYPAIADDYRRTFELLQTLKPDIWLAPHTESFDFDAKRDRAATEGVAAWVDPAGYAEFVTQARDRFAEASKAGE